MAQYSCKICAYASLPFEVSKIIWLCRHSVLHSLQHLKTCMYSLAAGMVLVGTCLGKVPNASNPVYLQAEIVVSMPMLDKIMAAFSVNQVQSDG
jgi:hypothetical protein